MPVSKVIDYLSAHGIDAKRVIEFEASSATVELAAALIGCEPALIAKSITFNLDGRAILIVASGDVKIDNRKYKERFGGKARMMSHEEASERIGHDVGGVCPFAVNEGVEVYMDISLRRFEYVYPAAGSSNSVICMPLDELERLSNSLGWVDVCKHSDTL
jgi:prolyl-tRNA editing enzyme YbaK/EbsC (Cys-tRNA(Pro) deacylase)